MKELLYFLGLVAAGALGYKFEPKLRSRISEAPRPVEVIEQTVVIEAGGASAPTPEPATDLAQHVAKPPVVPADETPVPPAPMPETAAPVTGDSQELPADATPAPTPAPEVMPLEETAPAPAAEPAPAPTTETPPAPAAAGTGDPVKAMQESIKAGQIKEFTFEQVLNWEAGADETVDGETYQTGLASYKAETIFGVKTIQAKALLKGGKVQRWIWPKSGMEIK